MDTKQKKKKLQIYTKLNLNFKINKFENIFHEYCYIRFLACWVNKELGMKIFAAL
jgi:hypothetical protein